MNKVKNMVDLDLSERRVLIRQDLNVPIKNGVITSDKRIAASIPTLEKALQANAAVMVMSHLGRPSEGEYAEEFSLAPLIENLSQRLKVPVRLEKEWLQGVEVLPGEVVLCENVRFQVGEKKNDDELAKKMAALCDVYVMDAFGTAHRAQASTHGVAKYAPIACAGPLLSAELEALDTALANPKKPLVAIVGGSKVSSKLTVLEALIDKVDQLIVGGGIANTFLAAQGYSVGKSLYEPDLVDTAAALIEKAKQRGAEIPLPEDVVCATEFSETASAETKSVTDVCEEDLILDVGPKAAAQVADYIQRAGTVVWNGPLGVFEFEAFAQGTRVMSEAVASSQAFSIAGGGDTLAAIDQFGISSDVSYISTGGGAFLEFLEGKTLPAVDILQQRAAN